MAKGGFKRGGPYKPKEINQDYVSTSEYDRKNPSYGQSRPCRSKGDRTKGVRCKAHVIRANGIGGRCRNCVGKGSASKLCWVHRAGYQRKGPYKKWAKKKRSYTVSGVSGGRISLRRS